MGTVPTGKLERELRAHYLRWLAGVTRHMDDLPAYINQFENSSRALIKQLGGRTASLGALAGFPAPRTLELSPVAGVVYDQMRQAAIKAGIGVGLNPSDTARQMLNAGLDTSFRRLNRLARTETVSAYWKNQWDSAAGLPTIVMVWGAENSKRTCDYCQSRDGLVVEDPWIRDHPNGRCTLIPTPRSQVRYKGTLQADGSVYMDPAWTDRSAASKGMAGPTTEAQRDPMSGKSNPAAPSKAQAAQGPGASPIPEEKFVANLHSQLKSGKLSVDDLRGMAANASPLGKANAEAAIARFQKVTPAKVPFTATPKGVAGSLTDDQLAALLPKRGGWTTATRDQVLKVLKSTPQGRSLEKTLRSFQFGGSNSIPRLRTDIEKYLTGGTLEAGRREAIETLLGAIKQSEAGARTLYRGMMLPGSADDLLLKYKAGDNLDLSLASFTSDKKTGIGFASPGGQAGKRISTKNNTGMLVEWVGDSKKALPIENLSPSRVFSEEKEWLGAGKFEIISVKKVKRDGLDQVVVQIRQKETW
jgi:hypothetical protein